MRIEYIPMTAFDASNFPRFLANMDVIKNAMNGHLGTENFPTGGLSTTVLDRAVPYTASGQYTGDGTANREINVGFMPRFVLVLSHTNSYTYWSLGDGTQALAAWWLDGNGIPASGLTDWQGVSANGFKCGSNTASGSNISGYVYSYFAIR